MNLGAVSDDVSNGLAQSVAPTYAEQGFGWLLDSLQSALDDLSANEETPRAALIEFAVRGFLLVRFLRPEIEPGDLFLDVTNAAQAHTRYLPSAGAVSIPALYARLLGYVSRALQRSAGAGDDFAYQELVEAIALAELSVAMSDEASPNS